MRGGEDEQYSLAGRRRAEPECSVRAGRRPRLLPAAAPCAARPGGCGVVVGDGQPQQAGQSGHGAVDEHEVTDGQLGWPDGAGAFLQAALGPVEERLLADATVFFTAFDPATVADLKPGERVFVVAGKKQPDGTVLAPSIVVGRKGVNPPM